jgi:hypothetical protein
MSETPDQGDEQPGQQPPPPPGAGFGQPDPYGQGAGFGQQAAFGQGTPYGQGWGTPAPADPTAPADLSAVDGPAPILVSFAPAQPQSRVTVGFRFLMAIPALIVAGLVGIAAEVVAFIGWWAALFMGRLPDWAFEFLTGYLRWVVRVQAYTYLLTDKYPPFSLDDDPYYPVRLVTRPTALNRLAVFFRVILAIPAYILAAISGFGMAILGFFAWLITLFTGQLPDSLHQAFTAIIRYYARFLGYILLVTPEYPSGLYGDGVTAVSGSAPVADPAAGTVASGSTFGEISPGDTAPITGFQTPFASPAGSWQLSLTGSAKNLVTVGLVVGVLGLAGDASLAAVTLGNGVSTVNRAIADATVTNDYQKLGTVLTSFQAKTEACAQNLSCVTALDAQVSRAFQTFGTGLAGAGVPSDFAGDSAALAADNTKVKSDFDQLATAQSASQYTSIASSLGLQSDLTAWQDAFNKLHSELDKP